MRQSQVIAARIAFECLMEFVYVTCEGNLIPAKKSKLKSFRRWSSSQGHTFGWMTFYALVVSRFDKEHRTPEIHGTSSIAKQALHCDIPAEMDSELDLTNQMMNIWPSVLQTLEGGEVTGCSYGHTDEQLFKEFSNWKNLDLERISKNYLDLLGQ